jgi:hypothetical protein
MLNCEVDEDDESHFRFLIDGLHVKYVTIDASLYSIEEMTFRPTFVPMLSTFPPGD